jgi:hypothetical protein
VSQTRRRIFDVLRLAFCAVALRKFQIKTPPKKNGNLNREGASYIVEVSKTCMLQDMSNVSGHKRTQKIPTAISKGLGGANGLVPGLFERKQTFTKTFRWHLPDGQKQEPAAVEVVGTFTNWEKVPLVHDRVRGGWHVTLDQLTGNRTHHYMLLADGQPVRDKHCDGLALPRNAQEAHYALATPRGPRVFMLFAQTK